MKVTTIPLRACMYCKALSQFTASLAIHSCPSSVALACFLTLRPFLAGKVSRICRTARYDQCAILLSLSSSSSQNFHVPLPRPQKNSSFTALLFYIAIPHRLLPFLFSNEMSILDVGVQFLKVLEKTDSARTTKPPTSVFTLRGDELSQPRARYYDNCSVIE